MRNEQIGEKYFDNLHSDEPGVTSEILLLKKKLQSGGYQKGNSVVWRAWRDESSLLLIYQDNRHSCVLPLLSVHQDLCQPFPAAVVLKLQHRDQC